MADFSKQYCELYDPEMPHDFDIDMVASTLNNHYYKSYICEGFGFIAIGKDSNGEITLCFPNDNSDSCEWVLYKVFMQEQLNIVKNL